jgi:glutathione peroxidase-family protein
VHRFLTFEVKQEADVVNFIHERFEAQNYPTQRDILNYVKEKFQKTFPTDG